jgi:uncharacterized membrane protein YidH (DUF202 family)
MGAFVAWSTTVLAILGLAISLHHLGVDVAASIVSTAHSVEHFLNTPIIST